MYKNETSICTYCAYHLPKTNYHLTAENPVAKLFWGRVPLHSGAAYYSFSKGGKVQNLIHQLKYKGRKEIGYAVGQLYGHDLKKSDLFATVTDVIPVPLHAKKLKKRGYNQSELFANGIADSMNVTFNPTALLRVTASETQTRKSRFSRWENVAYVFEIREAELLKGKHILLVDDVITTGATLEACAQKILEIPDTKVSIATIAFTQL